MNTVFLNNLRLGDEVTETGGEFHARQVSQKRVIMGFCVKGGIT